MKSALRPFVIIRYYLKYCVYYPIFRPRLSRAIAESNDELLGAIGWIDIDF